MGANLENWSHERLVQRVRYLEPYQEGLHRLRKEVGHFRNKLDSLKQENKKLTWRNAILKDKVDWLELRFKMKERFQAVFGG